MTSFGSGARVIAPAHKNLSGWAAVGNIMVQRDLLRPAATFNPSEGYEYLYSLRPDPLRVGLTTFQRKVMEQMEYWSIRGETISRLTPRYIEQTHRSFDLAERGLIEYSFTQKHDLASQLLFFGLEWLLQISNDPKPEVSLDRVELETERAHMRPKATLRALSKLPDGYERSRRTILFNRWIALKLKSDSNFAFELQKSTEFRGTNLSFFDLSALQATSSNFERTQFIGTRLLNADMSDSTLTQSFFLGVNASRINLRESYAREAQFITTILSGAIFKGARLFDTVFDRCALHTVDLRGAELKDCTFKGDLSGIFETSYNLKTGQYTFIDSYLPNAEPTAKKTSFTNCSFEEMEFEDCFLGMAHYENTGFKNLKYVDCNFSGATFNKTRFEGEVTFDNCNFATVDIDSLCRSYKKGATVTFKQCKGIKASDLVKLKNAGFIVIVRDKAFGGPADDDFSF